MKGKIFVIFLLYLFSGIWKSHQSTPHGKLKKRYFKIPAGKSIKIPFVMSKEIDYFEVYSERDPFQFEVVISGRKQKICKEEHENPNDDVFSLPRFCRHKLVNLFSHNIIYKIFMFPDAFDFQDILKYNGFTFTEFIINNTGLSDFYVREYIMPGSNAPISLLKECGTNNRKLIQNQPTEGRVQADRKDWPWMAAILNNKDSDYICWGVLITDRHVLAADYCLTGIPKKEMKVRLGEYNIQKRHEDSRSDFRIERILELKYHDNIGLVKLERPTSFSKFISPVCLPPRSETLETKNGIIVGRGFSKPNNNFSHNLEEITIPIFKSRECEATFPFMPFQASTFCGSFRNSDFCKDGVSGPLFIQQSDLNWQVLGFMFSILACSEDFPIPFNNVSYYLDWIQTNIET
ncbi:UNVERIFIED_CONTAM: hypothetical protein RMT77_001867 [Armadillidium vulgare]